MAMPMSSSAAFTYDHGAPDEGAAFVYLGSAAGLASTPAWMAEGDQSYALFGVFSTTAGDVNGDGYADLFVAAPWYSGDQYHEGRAYVYYGSASGLQTTPAWTAESNQDSAQFGYSGPGHAGDFNGDGYADIAIGAPGYASGHTDEGAAFVYHGGPDGLSTTADWSAYGGQTGSSFGLRASTAGDVNGDGYSDVVIGADAYDHGEVDEGAAFLFYGSPHGLESTPAWMDESNQSGAMFGYWVSLAGDVNGDGYSDVIIGARSFTDTIDRQGKAYLYHGSPAGLSPTPGWTALGEMSAAYFGTIVGTRWRRQRRRLRRYHRRVRRL